MNATRSDDTNLWCLYSLLNYNIPVVGGLNGHVLSAGGLLGFAKWLLQDAILLVTQLSILNPASISGQAIGKVRSKFKGVS